MSLKVMCAGCSAEERERAESDVRRALGTRAAGSETWIVSVINVQSRWSVTLDGPGIRALNCMAPPGRLAETIQEALQAKMGAPAPAAATPAGPIAPAAAPTAANRPAAAAPTRTAPAAAPGRVAAAPAAAAPNRAAPAPGRVPAPAALPRSAPSPPPAAASTAPPARSAVSAAGGPRRVQLECVQCHQRFRVSFDAIAGEPEHMTPVACPHCWHTNQVMVGETAADTSDYRAEKD
jgi:hypothetical protein